MQIAVSDDDVVRIYGISSTELQQDHPILVDKYLMGKEVEVDAVCDGERYPDSGYYGTYRKSRYSLR